MRLIPSSTVPISLHSSNLQSIASFSTFDNSISGHGQLTHTPKNYLCYSDLSHQNLIDNMKRHGFSWPFPHAHILSTHSNLTFALPNPLSPPFLPPLPSALSPPHWTISIFKYVRVHSTNIRCSSVTYETQDGIWTDFSHPLPLSHMESGNVP